MGGCECLSKFVVRVLNIVFLLAGLGIIGIGVYVYTSNVAAWAGKDLAIALFIFGGFCIVLAAIALCGAGDGNKCAMGIYAVFMTLLILGQIAIVILALTNEGRAKDYLQDRWNDLNASEQDEIMKNMKCGKYQGEEVILTDPAMTCTKWDGTTSYPANDNFQCCYDKAKTEFTTVGSVTWIICMVVAGIEVVLLIASCCILCDDDDDDKF